MEPLAQPSSKEVPQAIEPPLPPQLLQPAVAWALSRELLVIRQKPSGESAREAICQASGKSWSSMPGRKAYVRFGAVWSDRRGRSSACFGDLSEKTPGQFRGQPFSQFCQQLSSIPRPSCPLLLVLHHEAADLEVGKNLQCVDASCGSPAGIKYQIAHPLNERSQASGGRRGMLRPHPCPRPYSLRITVIGSTRTARTAGMRLPKIVITAHSPIAPMNVGQSPGCTPARSASIARPAA